MQIKLYFPIFNANQLFSPIAGEYKTSKSRLKQLSHSLQIQLKSYNRIPSKKLPSDIQMVFLINRDNFDVPALLLLAHQIIGTLRLTTTLQDTNNRCISNITISHKFVERLDDEGCIINFKD